MKKIIILIYFLINSLGICKKVEKEIIYTKFLEWGINNNLILSSTIQASFDKTLKFTSKSSIKANEILLTIPYDIMFNIEKALDLLESTTLKKQYQDYKNIIFEVNKIKEKTINIRKEESFFSYIFYFINNHHKKFKKSKFIKIYKCLLEWLKIPLKSKPFLLEDEEEQLKLYITYTFTLNKLLKNEFKEEAFIFKGNSYNNDDIEFEDYLFYRLFISNKAIQIFDHITIVPFLNFFETDYINYNANYTIENNGSIKVFSTKEIKENEEIIISSPKMSNSKRILFEGRTYEQLVDYFDEYLISNFGTHIYYYFEIEDPDLEYNSLIDLVKEDFDLDAIKEYKKHKELFKKNFDKKNSTGIGKYYELVINNIFSRKDILNNITISLIYKNFQDKEDRINIDRIIRGENNLINKANSYVEKKASKFIDIKTRIGFNNTKLKDL